MLLHPMNSIHSFCCHKSSLAPCTCTGAPCISESSPAMSAHQLSRGLKMARYIRRDGSACARCYARARQGLLLRGCHTSVALDQYHMLVGHTLMSGMTAIGRGPTSRPSICALAPLRPWVSSCISAPSDPKLCTACISHGQTLSTP